MTPVTSLAPLLERFFTQRLMHQRQASSHTIRSYRDTFRQFLIFAHQRLHQPPSRLNFEQFDAPLIVAFLDDLEKHRGITVRSRNLRLTAIHSTRRSNCQRRDIVVDQIIPRDSMAHFRHTLHRRDVGFFDCRYGIVYLPCQRSSFPALSHYRQC